MQFIISTLIVFAIVVILFFLFCLVMGVGTSNQGNYKPEEYQEPKYISEGDPFPRREKSWKEGYEQMGKREYGKRIMGGTLIHIVKADRFGRQTDNEYTIHSKTGKHI